MFRLLIMFDRNRHACVMTLPVETGDSVSLTGPFSTIMLLHTSLNSALCAVGYRLYAPARM